MLAHTLTYQRKHITNKQQQQQHHTTENLFKCECVCLFVSLFRSNEKCAFHSTVRSSASKLRTWDTCYARDIRIWSRPAHVRARTLQFIFHIKYNHNHSDTYYYFRFCTHRAKERLTRALVCSWANILKTSTIKIKLHIDIERERERGR